MSLLTPRDDDKSRRDLRQIGLYAAIPGILLAAPLIGYVIGWWLDGKLNTEPYLSALGIFLGIAAAGVEIFQLVKKASSTNDNGNDDQQSRT